MSSSHSADNLLTTRLRAETREAHERVEATLAPLTENLSISRYVELLSRWRAFFVYWEPAARSLLGPELALWFDSRRKLPWIDEDLAVLQHEPLEIVFPPSQLPIRGIADALGGIYVIEGSTLGGQVLCKRFGEALALTPQRGLRYFSSYGEETAGRWRETKQILNAAGWHAVHDKIVESAGNTFSALTDFFSSPLPFRTK